MIIDMMNYKFSLRSFIVPFYYLLMVVCISEFGQTFLGIGLSFFVCFFFLLKFILAYHKISPGILLVYLLLVIYCLITSILGKDLIQFFVVVFTISALFSLVKLNFKENEFRGNILLYSILSLLILILYNSGFALSNWNPNSISGMTIYGALGFIILFKFTKQKRYKVVILGVLLFFLHQLLLTDSRNAFIVIILSFITVIISEKIISNKIIFWLYCSISLFISSIIPAMTDFINSSTFDWFNQLSLEYFGKASAFSSRESVWETCRNLIGDNWLFGTGESLYDYIYSHNMYFSVIYMYGLIGYILYILLNIIVIRLIRKYAHKDVIANVCILIYIANMWGQIAENRMFTSNMAYFFPYIILSIALSRALKKKQLEQSN